MKNNKTLFNIYDLSNFDEGKDSIKAIINPALKRDITDSLNKIKKSDNIESFCEKINVSYVTFWGYINKSKAVPLFVLNELENTTQIPIHNNIEKLTYGTGSTKRHANAVKTLTDDLTKIIGAFAADGHLKQRNVKRGARILTHYELVFREEFLSNVKSLASWINNMFEINILPKKEKNHYYIYISNKIIYRHFEKLFGFKSGRKTETISAPDFIKNSDKNIKISFMRGVLMFDGYVNKSNGYIELYSKSENLIKDMTKMLIEIDLPADYISTKPDKFGRYRFIIRKQEKLRKCLILFEPNTEKWERLNSCIKNFRRTKQGGLKMSKDRSEEITELMKETKHIRNIAIAAHID